MARRKGHVVPKRLEDFDRRFGVIPNCRFRLSASPLHPALGESRFRRRCVVHTEFIDQHFEDVLEARSESMSADREVQLADCLHPGAVCTPCSSFRPFARSHHQGREGIAMGMKLKVRRRNLLGVAHVFVAEERLGGASVNCDLRLFDGHVFSDAVEAAPVFDLQVDQGLVVDGQRDTVCRVLSNGKAETSLHCERLERMAFRRDRTDGLSELCRELSCLELEVSRLTHRVENPTRRDRRTVRAPCRGARTLHRAL